MFLTCLCDDVLVEACSARDLTLVFKHTKPRSRAIVLKHKWYTDPGMPGDMMVAPVTIQVRHAKAKLHEETR
jgi:hypothetical protein